MAKRSNNFNSNRPHPYSKPYDSSNSSLVTRLTSRVSGLLPQPSGWLSRWLTPAEQEQQNQLRNVQDDDDIARQLRPPAKKLKLMSASPNDAANQQNHVRKDLELSPILRDRPTSVDLADGAVAGPSGLHLRSTNFVASTPAIPASAEPTVKVNGDEGSEGSETTSGCSSLVPQIDRTALDPFQSTSPKSSETPKFLLTPNSLDSQRFLFNTRNRSMDISNSFSRKRLTFDIHAFNNPLNKSSSSLNQTLQSNRLSSPFYRGRTMYGGSSSCVDSLSLSVVSASPKIGTGAKRVCVRPTTTSLAANQCEISSTAEQILRAIEQFSSPVVNAKKVQVRSDSLIRKQKALPIPFEDLVIPTVPDLLRMKRKERLASESSESAAAAPTSAASVSVAGTAPAATCSSTGSTTAAFSAASLTTPNSSSAVVPSATVAVCAATSTAVTSCGSATASSPNISLKYYQLPPPIQPLSTRDDEEVAEKVVVAPKTETANTVLLPPVPLSVPTSPTFRSSLPATATTSTRPRVSSSSSEFPVFSVSTVSSAPTFTLSFTPSSSPPKAAQKAVRSEFKFSSPKECEKPLSAATIKPVLKFREPQDAKTRLAPVTNHLAAFKSSPPVLKAKSPIAKDAELKKVPDKSLGSAANFFKTATKNDSRLQSLTDKFKPASSNWTCNTCLVSNSADKLKCCCCETPNTGKAAEKCGECLGKIGTCSCSLKKSVNAKVPVNSLKMLARSPSSTWECLTCLVSNKSLDSKCVACSAAKPGSATEALKADADKATPLNAAPSLNALFKKDAKSWECSVCMVNNKSTDEACVACGEKNPKAPTAAKPAAKFSFGIPLEAAGGTSFTPAPFSFGVSEKKDTKENASFKLPNNVEQSGFTFGKTTDESKKEDKANFDAKGEKTTLTFDAKNLAESISTSFQFSAPKGDAGKSNFISTSNAASSSTDAKAPTEKFGPISTGVSSTTDPATLQAPSLNFGIFAQKPPATTNSLIFGADKPFGFQAETDKFGQKEVSGGLFGMPAPTSVSKSLFSPKKGFFNQPDSKDNKSIFGGVKPDFGSAKPDFGSTKSDFGRTKPDLGTTEPDFGTSKLDFGVAKADFGAAKPDFTAPKPAFDVKPNDGFHVFGSQTAVNSTAANEQPKTFGASPFVFKGIDAPKATGGFSFPTQNSAPPNPFGFSNANETPPMFGSMAPQAAAQVAPMYDSMGQPMFNSAPQTNATPAPFAFGAQPQQQGEQAPAPAFGFPATQPQAAATPFSFSASNSMSTATPAQPPTFDPNIKPCFNFTSGAIPSFAAPPSTSTDANPQRKIRRAIRRTQQPR